MLKINLLKKSWNKPKMKIGRYINTDENGIRDHNIFIGVSLGNKYFTTENLKKYILWALEHTKEGVLVVIADSIHAINYEILSGYSKTRAQTVAMRQGEEIKSQLGKITSQLAEDSGRRIHAIGWNTARSSGSYGRYMGMIQNEFNKNPDFKAYILKIVDENIGERSKDLSETQREQLAQYVLDELPLLLCGIEYEGKLYTLHPYPGLSSFDYLLEGLSNGKLFPELASQIEIKKKPAIVEVYAES